MDEGDEWAALSRLDVKGVGSRTSGAAAVVEGDDEKYGEEEEQAVAEEAKG